MKRILVIDDNHDAADALATILELAGHPSCAVYGAVEGLDAIRAIQPDIVFLDIGMPVMNGYQVAKLVRQDEALKQPYLIAFTAWDDRASIARSREAGFNRHLAKTSDFEELLRAIQEVLRAVAS